MGEHFGKTVDCQRIHRPTNKSLYDRQRKMSVKLPAQWAPFLTTLLLSIFMSSLVSFVVTFQRQGASFLVLEWMHGWGTSWLVAYPSLLLIFPLVKRLVSLLVNSGAEK